MNPIFSNVLDKAKQKETLTKEDLVVLLSATGEDAEALYAYASEVREANMGNDVHLRGIIEFSNYCKQQCHYCGLRAGNQNASRYRLTKEQILFAARNAAEIGYGTLVLQAGEDHHFTPEDIADIIREVKAMGVAITLSFGEHPYEIYKMWREAGADRYLIKQECADPEIYAQIRPGKTLEGRIQCQKWLKELGFQVGSGCMVGLPGQTLETLADDLLLMKEIDVDMSGIGPFIPHPDTPLSYGTAGSVELTLNVVAIARILLPKVHLPATTSLASIHPQGRALALKAGANVVMPNVSPHDFRKFYQLYPGKVFIQDSVADHRKILEQEILATGRTIGTGQGHSPKLNLEGK